MEGVPSALERAVLHSETGLHRVRLAADQVRGQECYAAVGDDTIRYPHVGDPITERVEMHDACIGERAGAAQCHVLEPHMVGAGVGHQVVVGRRGGRRGLEDHGTAVECLAPERHRVQAARPLDRRKPHLLRVGAALHLEDHRTVDATTVEFVHGRVERWEVRSTRGSDHIGTRCERTIGVDLVGTDIGFRGYRQRKQLAIEVVVNAGDEYALPSARRTGFKMQVVGVVHEEWIGLDTLELLTREATQCGDVGDGRAPPHEVGRRCE